MHRSKEQGKYCPLKGLEEDGQQSHFLAVFHKILDQFLVVEVKPDQASYREDDDKEEEVNHEDVRHLVDEVETEEVPALGEKVEGEKFHVALVHYVDEHSVERVLADYLGDPVVEEGPEQ